MEFSYLCLNSQGEKVRGFIEANTMEEAVKFLKDQGFFPIEVKKSVLNLFRRSLRVKRKDLILFTMQLQSIISSGVPITVGLESLKEEAVSKDLKKVIDEIRLSLLQGNSIYETFNRFKNIFPQYYLGALKVGEESGTLPKTLEKIISVMEREEEQKDKTIKALIYPAFAVTTILLAAVFYLFYVLPRVLELVKGLGASLPLVTKVVIALVDLLKKVFPLILFLIVFLIFGLVIFRKNQKIRELLDKWLVEKLGLISSVLIKSFYAQFTTFLALMLESGVDMSTALELLTFSSGNSYLIKLISRLRALVTSGLRLGEALKNLDFPPLFCSMVSIGEETGSLPRQLNSLSKYYETELIRTVERLQALLEPILIIFIGAFAALIFVSVLLPIYSTIGGIR